MTGAPIYLVSACTSGEEFVAAFRRYADKTGLFVPISEPLPTGYRGRFAVTLKDGGVMIEGEAEIVNSARTASVLHGRVGMTLRFLEPDAASKTLLGELEKARLAMRPAPPSVSPRPAELPAEPRPVPPPVQGRIDAINSLAECVAIGDTGALVPPAVTPPIAPPPKAGPRFVLPAVPPAIGLASRSTTSPRPATSPQAASSVPAISGFSATLTAVAPTLSAGPMSDTFVAVTPPEPAAPAPSAAPPAPRHAVEMPAAIPRPITSPQPAEPARDRLVSDTIKAVPDGILSPPSAPIEAGGVMIDPLPPIERGAAQRGRPLEVPEDADESEVPEVRGVASTGAKLAPAHVATHIGMPPVPRGPAPPSPPPVVLTPAPPIVAAPRPAVPEIEIAEPTDISLGPPEPVEEPPPPKEVTPQPPELPSARPRKTVIGVAITPPGIAVLPAAIAAAEVRDTAAIEAVADPDDTAEVADASRQTAEEVISTNRIVVGDNTVDASGPTMPPNPRSLAMLDEATPRPARALPPAGTTPASSPSKPAPVPAAPVVPAAPAVPAAPVSPAPTLPTGDWTIALDPEAPDGWSEPFKLVSPEHGSEGSPPDPPPVAAEEPSAASADTPPPAVAANPPPAVTASAPPPDLAAKRQAPRPDELLVAEPKVQIDPTLIEPRRPVPSDPPLRPMPPDAPLQPMPPDDSFRDAAASSPEMPGYGVPPGSFAASAPDMNLGTAIPPSPFLVPHGQPGMHGGEAPAYPIDPSYQVAPGAGLIAPSPFTAGGGGPSDPRYASETALPAQSGRRHLIIILVSALVVVAIGAVVLAVVSRKHDAGTTPGTEIDKPRPSPVEAPKPSKAAAISPDSTRATPSAGSNAPAPPSVPAPPAAKQPPEAPTAAPGSAAAATGSDAAASAAAPEASTCVVEVSSVPAGAEIVIEPNVVGTTPQKITLPCGEPVELAIRKGRFITATRTITPTPDGVKLKVALAKPTFLLKVSSTPAGAAITMNGRALGITPTTVKVPAFEASMLTITKDGYATQIETVTPKSNGVAVHATLKKLDRKKPR